MTKEIGTISELALNVGDRVKLIDSGNGYQGHTYKVSENGKLMDEGKWNQGENYATVRSKNLPEKFEVLERAQPSMFENKVPFCLLSKRERQILEDWEHDILFYNMMSYEWEVKETCNPFNTISVYRITRKPHTETLKFVDRQFNEVEISYELQDGVPVEDSVKLKLVEKG